MDGERQDAGLRAVMEVIDEIAPPASYEDIELVTLPDLPPNPADPAIETKLDALADLVRAARDDQRVVERELLTALDAARILNCDKERVAAWAGAGTIRAWKDGTRWRIPRAEVERLVREGFPRDPGKRGRPRKMPSATTVADEIRALRTRRR